MPARGTSTGRLDLARRLLLAFRGLRFSSPPGLRGHSHGQASATASRQGPALSTPSEHRKGPATNVAADEVGRRNETYARSRATASAPAGGSGCGLSTRDVGPPGAPIQAGVISLHGVNRPISSRKRATRPGQGLSGPVSAGTRAPAERAKDHRGASHRGHRRAEQRR